MYIIKLEGSRSWLRERSQANKFPASEEKQGNNWVGYYTKINCVALHDKINPSFLQSSDQPTHCLQQQQKSHWEKQDSLFWSYYNFGIISHSFHGYIIRIMVQNDDLPYNIVNQECIIKCQSLCQVHAWDTVVNINDQNMKQKTVSISWSSGSGCDTVNVCYTSEALGTRGKQSRETLSSCMVAGLQGEECQRR